MKDSILDITQFVQFFRKFSIPVEEFTINETTRVLSVPTPLLSDNDEETVTVTNYLFDLDGKYLNKFYTSLI